MERVVLPGPRVKKAKLVQLDRQAQPGRRAFKGFRAFRAPRVKKVK